MQIFVIGPPRSGTTIVTQMLNQHEQIQIFDEVDFIHAADFGATVVGKLNVFLTERGAYDAYRAYAEDLPGPAALDKVMATIIQPRTIWGEKNPMYATRLDTLRAELPRGPLPVPVTRPARSGRLLPGPSRVALAVADRLLDQG